MSRAIEDLQAPFATRVRELLSACNSRGCEMRPFFTLRSPSEQAELWRQSRTTEEIDAKIAELEDAGATFLARTIRDVGPRSGPKVTNAIPGFSWHQWGEAVDCFWVVDGTAEWSTTRRIDGLNGYRVYAEEADRMGLTAGGFWRRFKDWPHVQIRPESSPSTIFSLSEIDDEMQTRFA